MRFALVCFDLDGTLVDSAADIRAAVAHALTTLPRDEEGDARALAAAWRGMPVEELFALARPRGAADEMRRFVDAYRGYYHAHLVVETRPFPGVAETLAALDQRRARGLRAAVATTKRTATARALVDGVGLARHFDLVLGSDGLAYKPAPDVLLAAARALDRDPRQGVMVGDTERDVAAARAAGMRACGVTWGALAAAEMRALAADWTIDEFRQILPILDGTV